MEPSEKQQGGESSQLPFSAKGYKEFLRSSPSTEEKTNWFSKRIYKFVNDSSKSLFDIQ